MNVAGGREGEVGQGIAQGLGVSKSDWLWGGEREVGDEER